MAGKSSQQKGKAGEREVAEMLFYCTGVMVSRNLDQTRDGGHDLNGISGLSIEVKRQEKLQINTWWRQTIRQADNIHGTPVLAYRQNRKPWKFIVGYDKISMEKLEFLSWVKRYVASLPQNPLKLGF